MLTYCHNAKIIATYLQFLFILFGLYNAWKAYSIETEFDLIEYFDDGESSPLRYLSQEYLSFTILAILKFIINALQCYFPFLLCDDPDDDKQLELVSNKYTIQQKRKIIKIYTYLTPLMPIFGLIIIIWINYGNILPNLPLSSTTSYTYNGSCNPTDCICNPTSCTYVTGYLIQAKYFASSGIETLYQIIALLDELFDCLADFLDSHSSNESKTTLLQLPMYTNLILGTAQTTLGVIFVLAILDDFSYFVNFFSSFFFGIILVDGLTNLGQAFFLRKKIKFSESEAFQEKLANEEERMSVNREDTREN